jgi:phosphatidylglycerophosphatase A
MLIHPQINPIALQLGPVAVHWYGLTYLAAFALFRMFDALKPEPMAWADRHFKGFGPRGGFGIMLDDLLAAFCTLLVLALWKAWW